MRANFLLSIPPRQRAHPHKNDLKNQQKGTFPQLTFDDDDMKIIALLIVLAATSVAMGQSTSAMQQASKIILPSISVSNASVSEALSYIIDKYAVYVSQTNRIGIIVTHSIAHTNTTINTDASESMYRITNIDAKNLSVLEAVMIVAEQNGLSMEDSAHAIKLYQTEKK